jgi:hypothetical protein
MLKWCPIRAASTQREQRAVGLKTGKARLEIFKLSGSAVLSSAGTAPICIQPYGQIHTKSFMVALMSDLTLYWVDSQGYQGGKA